MQNSTIALRKNVFTSFAVTINRCRVFILAAFMLAITVGNVHASTRFWINTSATSVWTTVGNWSATSGGGTCGCIPVTGDDVTIGTGASNTSITGVPSITLNSLTRASTATGTLTLTGSAVNTITLSQFTGTVLTISGNLTLSSLSIANTGGGSSSGSLASGKTFAVGANQFIWNSGGNFDISQATMTNASGGLIEFNLSGGQVVGFNSSFMTMTIGGTLDIRGSGNKEIMSGITISSGGTLRLGGSIATITGSGATFPTLSSGSTLSYNFSSPYTVTTNEWSTIYSPNLIINSSGTTITMDVGRSVANLTDSAGTLALGSNRLTVTGNALNNGTITNTSASTAEIFMNNTVAQTLQGTGTYPKVEISNTGGVTMSSAGTLTISDSLKVTAGTLSQSSFTTGFTVSGPTIITSTISQTSTGGTRAFNGDVTVNGTFTEASALAVITFGGNLIVNTGATWNQNGAACTFNGANKSIGGTISSITIGGTVTITSPGVDTVKIATTTFNATMGSSTGKLVMGPSVTLNIAGGSSALSGGLDATTNTPNTVNYTASGTVLGTTYYNLGVSGSGITSTLSAATTVNHNLTITQGTLSDGNFLLSGPGSGTGTLDMSTSSTSALTLGNTSTGTTSANVGPLPIFATYTLHATASTITFNGSAAYNISATPAYGNLTLSAFAQTRTALGALTINGTLTVGSSSTFADAGFVHTVKGGIANSGTTSGSGRLLLTSGTATHTMSGSGTYSDSLDLNDNTNGATMTGNFTTSGVLVLTNGTWSFNGFTLTMSGTLAGTSGKFGGTTSSTFTITHTGSIGTYPITFASGVQAIGTFNMTGAGAAATLGSPLSIGISTSTGALAMTGTSGNPAVLTTTSTNVPTIINTGTTGVTVANGSYIKGPLIRNMAASITTGTYVFPMGKSQLSEFDLITASATTFSGTSITVEAFDTITVGSAATGFSLTSPATRYWNATPNGGSITAVGTWTIKLTESSGSMTSANAIGNASTEAGVYTSLGGSVSGTTITNVANAPATLGFFRIGTKGCFSGTYSIGPTGTFAKITNAVAALNGGQLCGNAIFELQSGYDGTTGETFPIVIGAMTLSSSTNTATFRPQSGVSSNLTTGNTTSTIFQLNGANNIIFDGVPGGSTGSNVIADSKWIIKSTSASLPTIQFTNSSTFTAGANNDTLRYLQIQGQNVTAGTGAVAAGTINFFNTVTPVTNGNKLNVITYCAIGDGASTPAIGIYSSGTATVGLSNDNNTVSNCNIFNYYVGGTTLSNGLYGINLQTGNSAWTISGNSFYQTTTRTPTLSNPNGAILISSSSTVGSNFTLNGNFIGGSGAGASGTWTQNATGVASTFTGINYSLLTTASNNTISNNVVKNISWSSSSSASTVPGVFAGIFANGNGGSSITGNTIGASTGTGSISVTTTVSGAISYGIGHSSGNGTISIQNDTIGSITVTGSTTSITHGFIGIQFGAGDGSSTRTISGNLIGSTATANSINLSNAVVGGIIQSFTGIANGGLGANATTCSNNIIDNINNATTGSGAGQTIGINLTSGINTITKNKIDSMTTGSAYTGTANSATIIGIVMNATSATGHTISNNEMLNLSCTNSGSVITHAVGLYFGSSAGTANTDANIVNANLISNLSLSTTNSGATIDGMYIGSSVSTRFSNNMIRIGFKPDGSSITPGMAISGIQETGTAGGNNYYFNSIYLGGTGVSGVNATWAFVSGATSGTRNIKDNIFFNARTPSTTTNFAMRLGALTGATSNFNDLVATNSTNLCNINGTTNYATLAAWQASAGTPDLNSISSDPAFISAAGTVANLHIQASPAYTPIEGAGLAIAAVPLDYDSTARSGLTPTDIGADAGNFASAPIIVYTALGGTASTSNRTLSNVSITDAISTIDSVDVSLVGKPRLYYKKSTNSNAINDNTSGTDGWKYVESVGDSTPFSFVIDYTLLNGSAPAIGTVIQYFVVAQDNNTTPIVGISAGTFPGASYPATVALATANLPTGTINSYTILTSISATYGVGTGGCNSNTYPTLTGTGGFFAAMNAGTLVLDKNVTVYITSSILETEVNALNQMTQGDGGPYTITITTCDATNKKDSMSSTTTLINLNGADYITFDGQYNGDGLKHLQFVNTASDGSANGNYSTFWFQNDATHDTIKNCFIQGHEHNNVGGVVFLGASTGTLGNSFNVITNDSIGPGGIGGGGDAATVLIGSNGSTTAVNHDNVISNNNLTDIGFFSSTGTLASAINITGTGNGSNWKIKGNSIYASWSGTDSRAINPLDFSPGAASINDTISGNYIGGHAPQCGGAIWINSYTAASYGLVTLAVGTDDSNPCIFSGNTINNFETTNTSSVAVPSVLRAINILSGSVSIKSANTIGSGGNFQLLSQPGFQGAYSIYAIYNASSNTVIVDSTLIAGIAENTTGITTGGSIVGIADLGTGTLIATNNTIGNLYNSSTSATAFVAAVFMQSNATGVRIENNYIVSIGNAASGTNAETTYGIYEAGTGNGVSIKNNQITELYRSQTGGFIIGIEISDGSSLNTGTYDVWNNNVYLNNWNPVAGGGPVDYTTFNTIFGLEDCGVSGSTSNIYHNTIFIDSLMAGSTGAPSACYYRFPNKVGNVTGGTVNLKNNILINRRSGGTNAASVHSCIKNQTTSSPGTGWNSDYNFVASPNSGTGAGNSCIGFWNASYINSWSSWQSTSSGDSHSTNAIANPSSGVSDATHINPKLLFTNITTTTSVDFNLKLVFTSTPSLAFISNLGTTGLPVTTDFEGDLRCPTSGCPGASSAPDIGADEFANPSVLITYTALTGTASTSNRSFTPVTITYASGTINTTSNTAPRLYYKKYSDTDNSYETGTGANTSAQTGWKWVECTSPSGSTYSFTIDYSKLSGGAVAGDNIQYFVVAQSTDATPQIGINSGTFHVPASVASVADYSNIFPLTGTINVYTILPSSGSFTVGTGGQFTSLTSAGGVFQALNQATVTGNMTFTVISDLSEDGTNALNQWTESGAGGYTVNIVPDGTTTRNIVRSTGTNDMIRFDNACSNGTSSVLIDGQFSSDASKHLRFRNTNTANSCITFLNDAQRIKVTNSYIESANSTTYTSGTLSGSAGTIFFSNAKTGGAGVGNKNDTITSCEIRDRSDGTTGVPANAIFSYNSTASTTNNSNAIQNNLIHNFSQCGVYLTPTGSGPSWNISTNSFYDTTNHASLEATVPQQVAIYLQGGSTSYSNTVSNNTIGGSASDNSGTWLNSSSALDFEGIRMDLGSTGTTTVSNNVIKHIHMSGQGFASFVGIRVKNGLVNVLHNQVGDSTSGNFGTIQVDGNGDNGATTYNNTFVYGIWNYSSNAVTIRGNIVAGLMNEVASLRFNYMTGIRDGYYEYWDSGHPTFAATAAATIDSNIVANLGTWSGIEGPGPSGAFVTAIFPNSLTGIMLMTNTTGNVVSNNTVYGLTVGGGWTRNVGVAGITLDGKADAGGADVYNNKIYNFGNTNSGRIGLVFPEMFGIWVGVADGSGSFNVYNNMISLSQPNTGSFTSSDLILNGIEDYNTSPNVMKYYNNTVVVSGTNISSGANGTSAYRRFAGDDPTTYEGATTTFKNNILINNRTGGSGTHKAIANMALHGTTGWTSNYNFFSNATTSTMGREYSGAGGDNTTNFTSWQSNSGGDANSDYAQSTGTTSYSTNPTTATVNITAGGLFVNPSPASAYQDPAGFLHISLTDGSSYQYVSNLGTDLSSGSPAITTDIDGTTRATGTPGPDIGADEFSTCSTPTAPTVNVADSCGFSVLSTTAAGGTLSWSPTGLTTSSITVTNAATYTVTLTVTGGCHASGTGTSAPLTLPATPTVSVTNNCNGTSTLLTTATGTLQWSTMETSSVITVSSPGTYTVTQTDVSGNGCTSTAGSGVAAPKTTPATPTVTSVDACGSSTLSITPTGTMSWSPGGQTGSSITVTNNSTYSVTVTVNGCSATGTGAGSPYSTPTASASHSDASCNGYSNGIATSTSSGGTTPYTYSWSTGSTSSSITGASNTYTLTITDSHGCTSIGTVDVGQPTAVTAPTISVSNGCGSSVLSTTSTGTLSWSNGASSTSITVTNAATYSVTTTNGSGCTSAAGTGTSAPNSSPTASASHTDVSCHGGTNGSATSTTSGGTSPYTYAWSSGETTSSISGKSATTYTLTVTDTHSCTSTTTVTISQPSALVASVNTTNIACNGASTGAATSTTSGGTTPYTYLWTGGSTASSISGKSAGTYTLTVTDTHSCTSSTSFTFTEPSIPLGAPTDEYAFISCKGRSDGAAIVYPNGGTGSYTYSWSPGGATTSVATGLTSGTYTITLTDANGCVATDTVFMEEPDSLTAELVSANNITCHGGSDGTITFEALGGNIGTWTYLWSPGGATTSTVTGLTAGTYTLSVSDINGCPQEIPPFSVVPLTEPTAITIDLTTSLYPVTCHGASDGSVTAYPSGGSSAPYTFLWSNGHTDDVISGLTAGTYTVTVTNPDGCTAIGTATITEPTVLSASAGHTDASCAGNDGTATSTTGGGTTPYTYSWSNGATDSAISGLTAGTYTLTVTDANSCSSTTTTTVGASSGCGITFTVKVFLQGYMLDGGTMSPLLKLLNASSSATAVDSVTIELHASDTTANYTYTGILHSDGNIVCSFSSAAAGSYYVVVKHRNSLTTYSASAQTISDGGSYDFTTGAGQAYGSGNRMAAVGSVYAIYSGDVNGSNSINASDKTSLQSALSSFTIGTYDIHDITGDGFVDEDDYRIIENNAPLSLTVKHP